jgi:predicted RNA-binding Zn-ribbon protein involved in translation (DUF1610 family)
MPNLQQPYQPVPQQGQAYQQQEFQPQPESISDALRGGATVDPGKYNSVRKGETHHCPECGSNNFFTRASTVSRGPAPAPLCSECGYNGLFEQFGNQEIPEQ